LLWGPLQGASGNFHIEWFVHAQNIAWFFTAAAAFIIVKKSIRYSMVTFHTEAIQQTIGEVGSRKEIKGLRIFDRKGRIAYSSDKGEVGLMVERKAEACTGCHDGGGSPAQRLAYERQWLINERAGERVLTFIEPLYNEPSCTVSCHATLSREGARCPSD
jgi:hypothetical protein